MSQLYDTFYDANTRIGRAIDKLVSDFDEIGANWLTETARREKAESEIAALKAEIAQLKQSQGIQWIPVTPETMPEEVSLWCQIQTLPEGK